MKKSSGLVTFILLFFTLKSFGGNNPLLLPNNLHLSSPLLFPKDSVKKTAAADTAKKTADDDSTDDDVRSYAMGITYQSNQSYHGIHSTKKIPFIEPNFTYTAPSGFYTEVFDQYNYKSSKFNLVAANPGWNIDLADNTTLNGNWSHYFLGANPPPTIATIDVSNTFETYLEQWVGETKGKLAIDYDLYKETAKAKTPNDWIITPDLEHDFNITLGKKSSLSINPEADIDFGTRNASSHYEVNNGDTAVTYVKTKNGIVAEPKTITNTSFGTLDYSLILTLDYKVGRFEIEPAINDNITLYNTTGASSKPLGYLTLALLYTIDHHPNK